MKFLILSIFFVFAASSANASLCDRLEREVLKNIVIGQCALKEEEDEEGAPVPLDYQAAAHAQRERMYFTEMYGRAGCNNKELSEKTLNQTIRRPNCPKRLEK